MPLKWEEGEDPLNSLNAIVRAASDPRPWVSLKRRAICSNCQNESLEPSTLMREQSKGHYVKATGAPLVGQSLREVTQDVYYARCEHCNGEQPLVAALTRAIQSCQNDRDLAQRAGHLLADFFKRRRIGGPGE
jgi:CelD/BcsL family acetyltransferase involved in cellulose biosynthesis